MYAVMLSALIGATGGDFDEPKPDALPVEVVKQPPNPFPADVLIAVTWGGNTSQALYPMSWRSDDGGATWTLLDTVDLITGSNNYSSVIAGPSGNMYTQLWGLGNQPRTYISTDNGSSWSLQGQITDVGLGNGEPQCAIIADAARLYVLLYDYSIPPRFYESTDWGATWTFRDTLPFMRGSGSGNEDVIDIATDNANNMYALLWNEDNTDPQCFYSSDGGATWTYRSTIAPYQLYDDAAGGILFDNGVLYCALWHYSSTTVNVFTSTDFGVTWNQTGSYTPPYGPSADNNFSSICTVVGGNVYSAVWRDNPGTYQPAVYRSMDGGASWTFSGYIPVLSNGYARHTVDIMPLYNPLFAEETPLPPQPSLTLEVRGTAVLLSAGVAGNLAVNLYDPAGRNVAQLYRGVVISGEELRLEAPGLKTGAYFVRATLDGTAANGKLTVR